MSCLSVCVCMATTCSKRPHSTLSRSSCSLLGGESLDFIGVVGVIRAACIVPARLVLVVVVVVVVGATDVAAGSQTRQL